MARYFLAEAQSSQRKAQKRFWVKTKTKDFDSTLRTPRALRETPFWFPFVRVRSQKSGKGLLLDSNSGLQNSAKTILPIFSVLVTNKKGQFLKSRPTS